MEGMWWLSSLKQAVLWTQPAKPQAPSVLRGAFTCGLSTSWRNLGGVSHGSQPIMVNLLMRFYYWCPPGQPGPECEGSIRIPSAEQTLSKSEQGERKEPPGDPSKWQPVLSRRGLKGRLKLREPHLLTGSYRYTWACSYRATRGKWC